MKSIETWKMNNPYTSIWEKLDILNWRTSLNNLYPNTFHAQHIQIHNSLVWIDRKCQSLSISLTISHSFRTQLFHHSRGAVVKFHKKFQAWLISLIFISLLFSCFYTISSLSPFLCTLSFHTSFPLIISRDLFCICSFSRFIWNFTQFQWMWRQDRVGMRCHYEVLEVQRDADDETIKKAYRWDELPFLK